MSKNKRIANLIFTLMTLLTLLLMSTVSALAVAEPDTPIDETVGYVETIYEPTEPQIVVEETEPEIVEEPEYIEDETEAFETYYDIYYEELPQVESQEVVEATTVVIPAVEVTETSLIGGVIAWLCVAVGIAVIAGVLVSQRTRQTSSKSSRDNRR